MLVSENKHRGIWYGFHSFLMFKIWSAVSQQWGWERSHLIGIWFPFAHWYWFYSNLIIMFNYELIDDKKPRKQLTKLWTCFSQNYVFWCLNFEALYLSVFFMLESWGRSHLISISLFFLCPSGLNSVRTKCPLFSCAYIYNII